MATAGGECQPAFALKLNAVQRSMLQLQLEQGASLELHFDSESSGVRMRQLLRRPAESASHSAPADHLQQQSQRLENGIFPRSKRQQSPRVLRRAQQRGSHQRTRGASLVWGRPPPIRPRKGPCGAGHPCRRADTHPTAPSCRCASHQRQHRAETPTHRIPWGGRWGQPCEADCSCIQQASHQCTPKATYSCPAQATAPQGAGLVIIRPEAPLQHNAAPPP